MEKPIIGLTMSSTFRNNVRREEINLSYIRAVEKAGGIPVPIPNTASGVELAKLCDGLLFTGGGDLDPSYYGEKPNGTDADSIERERDQTESKIISLPEFRSMPVLGICRGIQALTAFQGGSLIQDIESHFEKLGTAGINHRQEQPRNQFSHTVSVENGSILHSLFQTDVRKVNSMHHQAVARLPDGWIVSAVAEDGVIEAIEFPGDRFRVAVQWHPEELFENSPMDAKLFASFIESAGINAERRKVTYPEQ
ncbi:MAG: gamma-glutamyl-gamma-aminobutyrate hydrolase family protein [Thermoplasmata archaeon]|uniref:Gamma-glutamyl-gamma-aminobutyrate hydrolase family protein n=1 Tax=Candidatus Sysuiplasma superficiale TaxID=2823368 RepID=A0A8J8CDE9_9ARCH|nr:gamma-glutamyl-gamma-aminobutyrate hydrolase family protein [Candidatus Sysuiplasma superficiale]MBX8643934.1 gamma-glutamyl-gamma-aminobutyrate hydrolase family protein [Candidatus Sysuiplasma superficiale]MCL4346334.1 gamma-glutamyl-gamma-aminobutyrate hydrolase family protein [Candidatus Thermoplasmatota archaeon]